MRMITGPQLKLIHTLLGELEIKRFKEELVTSYTGGRTESSREMTMLEAKALIEYLKGSHERTEVVNRIWHMAYEMDIIVSGDQSEKAMNAAKLDAFCEQRGSVKKRISFQTLPELKRTAKQFEAMYKKYTDKRETLQQIEALKGYLGIFVKHENYEEAAKTKKLIDDLTAEITPKRKRTVKAV